MSLAYNISNSFKDLVFFSLFPDEHIDFLISESEVVSFNQGELLSEENFEHFLVIVMDGVVGGKHTYDTEFSRKVTAGKSIELGGFFKNQKGALNWHGIEAGQLLLLSKKTLNRYFDTYPEIHNYLKMVSTRPEIQKFKNDLNLCGFEQSIVQKTITSLQFTSEINDLKIKENLAILQSGEVSITLDASIDDVKIFSSGEYFYLKEELDADSLKISKDFKAWFINKKIWQTFADQDVIESFVHLVSPEQQDSHINYQNEAIQTSSSFDEDDDGLNVSDFTSAKSFSILGRRKPIALKQQDEMDCGAACLAMVSKYYGRKISISAYRSLVHVTREGASMLSLKKAAEMTGYQSIGIMSGINGLAKLQLPCIALMQYHFVVVYEITDNYVLVADPADDLKKMDRAEFDKDWSKNALLLKPTPALYKYPETKPTFLKYSLLLSGMAGHMTEVVLISLLIFIFGLATPLFMQFVFDSVLEDRASGIINAIAIGAIILTVLSGAADWVRAYLLTHMTSQLDSKFSALFMRHVFKLPLSFFAVRRVGDITTRLQEIEKVRELFTDKAIRMIVNIITVFLYSAVIYLYSPKLFIVLSVTLPVLAGFIAFMVPKITRNLQDTYRAMAKNQSMTFEHMSSVETLKSTNSLVSSRWKWEEGFYNILDLRKRLERLNASIVGASEFLQEFVKVSILLTAIYLYLENEFTLGQVVAISSIVGSLIRPLIEVVSEWNAFNQVAVSMARIDDVITSAIEPDVILNDVSDSKLQLNGNIQFENVSFQYGSEMSPLVLNNVSLTINSGETIAFVGSSGSGKTTLAYMINLLYEPTKGRVLLDGIDATKIPKSELRKQVSMIIQENPIFSGTLLDNICLGDPHPSLSKAMYAAEQADAHEFIANLPEGYSTQLGESGAGLSGGQKQRINIARALYQEPNILIMDEATSALDSFSEQVIVKNIKARKNKQTTILIAHRLNTIMHADRIYVLDSGELIESGSHSELLKQKGRYYQLFKKQLNL